MLAKPHEDPGVLLNLFRSGLKTWVLCISAGFLVVASRQNLLVPTDDLDTTHLLDAITFGTAATAAAFLFLRKHHDSLTFWRALAIGIFWVVLSLASETAVSYLLETRYALRFLLSVLLGTSDPTGGWVFGVFLTLQLTTLPAMKILLDGVARLRSARIARQH